jgi:hypothetical protein
MLIIISGVETINKKFFATNVVGRLNTFVIDGYHVHFTDHDFEVVDPATDQTIYPSTAEEHSEFVLENQETFDKILALQQTIFLEGLRDNHFRNTFVDILADYGIAEPTFSNLGDEKLIQPHEYQDIIYNYNNRSYENFTITGSFSKVFVDRIRSDLGTDNIQVYNIIRNPSVCYLIQEKNPEHYQKYIGLLDPEMDHQKLILSLVNCASLMRDPSIVTLRFEDMIQAGSFVINGKEVTVPKGYEQYNEWLTVWEKENITPLEIVSPEALDLMNQYLTTWATNTFTAEKIDAFNALTGSSFTTSDNTRLNLPQNIFTELGYAPLSLDTIVSE